MHSRLFFIAVLLIGVCTSQDLRELIQSVFNKSNVPSTGNKVIVGPSKKACSLGKECIREYLCSNGHTNTDGATIINVRFDIDEPVECPFLETCCSPDDVVTVPIVRTADTPTKCGYRNTEGVGFKIEGATTEAEFGEFPWMLAILRGKTDFDEERNYYQCGGSLIHPQVVVTGAHCVYGRPATAFKARAGEWDTNSKAELYPDQNRNVVDMIVHEKYNNDNLQNDIALLFLESPFKLAPNVNTLCLPPPEYVFDFSRCFATGWGKDQFEDGRYQNILKKIEVPVVPSYLCLDNLRKTRLGKYFLLDPSFMCAGGELGKDTCEGDGGSPLVCRIANTTNRYYQAGIVSWGIGCGEKDVPGVYGNVVYFRSWIDEQLAYKNIDSSYYTA